MTAPTPAPTADDVVGPLLRELLDRIEPRGPAYPRMIAIRAGDQYPLVRVEDIDSVEAEGNYARLHLGKVSRLINRSLTELETRVLDPRRFARIHRSTIVNLRRIEAVVPLLRGEMTVFLSTGRQVVCSRRFRRQLQEHIHFTS